MKTIERMYIEFLELENDDLVQSLINQRCTIENLRTDCEKEKSSFELTKNSLDRKYELLYQHYREKSGQYTQIAVDLAKLAKERSDEKKLMPLINERLLDKNKYLADKIRELRQEIETLTNNNYQ